MKKLTLVAAAAMGLLSGTAVMAQSMPIRLTPKALHVVITALPVQTNPPQRRTHRRSAL